MAQQGDTNVPISSIAALQPQEKTNALRLALISNHPINTPTGVPAGAPAFLRCFGAHPNDRLLTQTASDEEVTPFQWPYPLEYRLKAVS